MKYHGLFILALIALQLNFTLASLNLNERKSSQNDKKIKLPDHLESKVNKQHQVRLPNGEFFLIQNNQSGKCLDSSSGDMRQSQCEKLNPYQKWKIETNPQKGNPWVTITNALGKRVDNKSGSMKSGNKYWVYEVNWSPAQSFKVEQDEEESILINESSKLCLDIKGDDVVQDECNRATNQKWTFIKIQAEAKRNIAESNKNSGSKGNNHPSRTNPQRNQGQTGNNNSNSNSSKKTPNNIPSSSSNKPRKKRFSGFFQIRNLEGKCFEDTLTGQKIRLGSCNVYEDGFFFRFKRNKNDKTFYIISALGNVLNYQDGVLTSKLFKKGERQKFRLKQRKSGGFKIKTDNERCLTTENGDILLSPCTKQRSSQRFEIFSYRRIFRQK